MNRNPKKRQMSSSRKQKRQNLKDYKKLSSGEKIIANLSLKETVKEFNLIQSKESKLSEHLQKCVLIKVSFYIREGKIKLPENAEEQKAN